MRSHYSRYTRLSIRGLNTYANSGPLGVDGRIPVLSKSWADANSKSNALSITDPYIIYQSYVHLGVLEKDEMQLRTIKELQKLYHKLIDYQPPDELQTKISLLLRKIEIKHAEEWANMEKKPLPLKLSAVKNLFSNPHSEKKELIRIVTDEEELHNFNSPHGLLINGEVGCGKTMLVDIFATSLPHKSKMRWHYNNFILWVFNEMHNLQRERYLTAAANNGKKNRQLTMENEFVLFEIAQKMINKSTILILDEFMLPDIAAANIIKILFTYYFKLGGVLVATSNKLPEELYSNDFNKSKFKNFVGILNARCKSVDMKSEKDYRAIFSSKSTEEPFLIIKSQDKNHEENWLRLIKSKALEIEEGSDQLKNTVKLNDLGSPSSFEVYGRRTHVPLTFNDNSVCYFDFSYICQGLFASSDYITLASRYRTVVIDNIPIMTVKMKNEARRFITMLDALYESRCKVFMRTEVEIDELFFPDQKEKTSSESNDAGDRNIIEVQNEEMYAKTAMDISNPYRPNVSTYDQKHTETYDDFKTILNSKISGKTDSSSAGPLINYKDLRAFTGEDERFAYKRAVLRIKEMVGSDNWREGKNWVPIDHSMRPWETSSKIDHSEARDYEQSLHMEEAKLDQLIQDNESVKNITHTYLSNALPRDFSESNNIPFRKFNARFAPIFSSIQHFWAMGSWTQKQGEIPKDTIVRRWIKSSIRNSK